MKFGKRFKAVQREGWVYLDYKGLKQLIKKLATLSEAERQQADTRFLEEVCASRSCACCLVAVRQR
jgi:SPX domain protein involved in polyphosphate accumulation